THHGAAWRPAPAVAEAHQLVPVDVIEVYADRIRLGAALAAHCDACLVTATCSAHQRLCAGTGTCGEQHAVRAVWAAQRQRWSTAVRDGLIDPCIAVLVVEPQ